MIGNVLATLVACLAPAPEVAAPAKLVSIEDVLHSVERDHPSLAASRAGRARADGVARSARGAFDPRVRSRVATQPAGYYQWTTVETEVRARTVAFGLAPFAGWRLGRGEFPIYDGRLATARGGEIRAGFELPLLRDGWFDAARANRRKADNGRSIARLEVEQRRLELLRDAALAYWDWVASGERMRIRARLLELARERDAGIRRQIGDGNMAEIEAIDNERVILTREVGLVAAERDARRAALELSLFLRDRSGRPTIVASSAAHPELVLPSVLVDEGELDDDIAVALTRRPDVALAARRVVNTDIDVRLAKSQLLPTLTGQAYVAKDLGDGPAPLLPTELGVGAVFEIPIALRGARGDLQVARADRSRARKELQFLGERVAVDVRTAYVEMSTARRRAQLAARQAEVAERLAAAERDRFALGDSTILVVNLREEAAADAAAAEVDALADYRKARARYQTATGSRPTR